MFKIKLGKSYSQAIEETGKKSLSEQFLKSRKDVDLFPTIKLLEEVEDFETGLHYFKHGLDSDGLSKGSKLFKEVYDSDKKILIATDYDCDGINSAVVCEKLINKFLDPIKFTVIVNKRRYGNGLNKELFKDISFKDYGLLITADHGSSNEQIFLELKDEYPDLKIVLTDHHIIPQDNFPISVDVLLNNMSNESFNKNLSGCYTVWFFFMYVLNKKFNVKAIDALNEVIENLALTVISDVMSCKEPVNRMIYQGAVFKANLEKVSFFNLLRKFTVLPRLINLDVFRFLACPAINSGNRLHEEETAKSALHCDEVEMGKLVELNNKRKKVTNIALDKIRTTPFHNNAGIVCVIKTNLGINGIIASKLGSIYRKPTICFTREDGSDVLHGSCRSIIPGVDMLEIIKILSEKDLVDKFGGHSEAVGCTTTIKKFEEFTKQYDILVANAVGRLETDVEHEIDGFINVDDINIFEVDALSSFEPFGKDFPDPSFYTEFTVLSSYVTETMGRIKALGSYGAIDFVVFNNINKDLYQTFKVNNRVGCIFTPTVNNYRGKPSLKLLITQAVILPN